MYTHMLTHVNSQANLSAFRYEEAATKLPCRPGFETYCKARLREAGQAQVAACTCCCVWLSIYICLY